MDAHIHDRRCIICILTIIICVIPFSVKTHLNWHKFNGIKYDRNIAKRIWFSFWMWMILPWSQSKPTEIIWVNFFFLFFSLLLFEQPSELPANVPICMRRQMWILAPEKISKRNVGRIKWMCTNTNTNTLIMMNLNWKPALLLLYSTRTPNRSINYEKTQTHT